MNTKTKSSDHHKTHPPEVVDLLPIEKSSKSHVERVKVLQLSKTLEQKIADLDQQLCQNPQNRSSQTLTADEEKELANEVLMYRHRFTEHITQNRVFRQAALSVVQNIYLFRNRKIFFSTSAQTTEEERQEAIQLLSSNTTRSVPLRQAFQHLIIARVWQRIISQISSAQMAMQPFTELHQIVERLNTLRNIYVTFTTGLVRKLASQISDICKQSVSYEDAVQIGSFGIARAAYRYYPINGIRFSTYASKWVFAEIQRQALRSRLIKISANSVEQFSHAQKNRDTKKIEKYSEYMRNRSFKQNTFESFDEQEWGKDEHESLHRSLEKEELRNIIDRTIDTVLAEKSADIIRRRFGLPPYELNPQSVISISKHYGVTRSSIYQMERTALKNLQEHLATVC